MSTATSERVAPHEARSAAYPSEWECRGLLADGTLVSIRPIRPDDGMRLEAFHEHLTQETVYKRYFNAHPHLGAPEIERFTNVDYHRRMALVSLIEDRFVGIARYDAPPMGAAAEVAFVVSDELQGHGVGTLLLEHLAAAARRRGIGAFEADTLAFNGQMQDMFRQAGFERRAQWADGIVHVSFPIAPTQVYLDAVLDRHALSVSAMLDHRVERIGAGPLRVVCCSGWSACAAKAAALDAGIGLSDLVVTADPSLGLAAFSGEGGGPVVVDLDTMLRPRTFISVARHAGIPILALDRGNRFADVCRQAGISRTCEWTKAVVAANGHPSVSTSRRGAIIDLPDCDVATARRLLDSRADSALAGPAFVDKPITSQLLAAYGVGRPPRANIVLTYDGTGLTARAKHDGADQAISRLLPLTDRDAVDVAGADWEALLRLARLIDDQADIGQINVRPEGVRIELGKRRGIRDDPFVRTVSTDLPTQHGLAQTTRYL